MLWYFDSMNDSCNFQNVLDELKQTPLFNKENGDYAEQVHIPQQTENECSAFACLYLYLSFTKLSKILQKPVICLFAIPNLSQWVREWMTQTIYKKCIQPLPSALD